MTDDPFTVHGDERQNQSIGLAQSIYDERLRPIAERETGEGTRGERADHVPVISRLSPYDDIEVGPIAHRGVTGKAVPRIRTCAGYRPGSRRDSAVSLGTTPVRPE